MIIYKYILYVNIIYIYYISLIWLMNSIVDIVLYFTLLEIVFCPIRPGDILIKNSRSSRVPLPIVARASNIRPLLRISIIS